MGFLHQGHLSLLRQSKKENDISVLSIFVNPLQFGDNEDYEKYPRDKKRDELFAKKEKIDIIFYPSIEEMYSSDYLTFVNVDRLSQTLCGQSRPGHFRGVTTVVAKLTNSVLPDVIYLGQKDAQQSVIIQKMINDLNWPVRIKILPTVRDQDGLALSSRNRYLSKIERHQASCLYESLKKAETLIRKGEQGSGAICRFIKKNIANYHLAKIDYVACVDAKTLQPLKVLKGSVLIALGVFIGKTRLIDNMVVNV